MSGIGRWVQNHKGAVCLAALGGVCLGLIASWFTSVLAGFSAIASEEFSPVEAAENLGTAGVVETPEPFTAEFSGFDPVMLGGHIPQVLRSPERIPPPKLPDEMFTSVLLIGADASGHRADSIVYMLFPSDGSAPLMVSIPRDLYTWNPCKKIDTRINANLGGCTGMATGTELLALAVGDFTGINVDHFAKVDFKTFPVVVDRLGGVTVCNDVPLRDVDSGLDLPEPGCRLVDGATALAWVRSRHPEQLVEEEWVVAPWSDFTRQKHQRDVLFQLGRKLASYGSLVSLGDALGNLSGAVKIDSGWSLLDVARLGFRFRSYDDKDIINVSIPVENHRTTRGELVLLPTEPFAETFIRYYGPASGRFEDPEIPDQS